MTSERAKRHVLSHEQLEAKPYAQGLGVRGEVLQATIDLAQLSVAAELRILSMGGMLVENISATWLESHLGRAGFGKPSRPLWSCRISSKRIASSDWFGSTST